MKTKLTLWVNEDEQRVLQLALQMYQQKLVSAITSSDFQEKFIRLELGMTTELISQLEKKQYLVSLPTIIKQNDLVKEECKISLRDLQKGDAASIMTHSSTGDLIQVVFDQKDRAYSILVDGKLVVKNQDMSHVSRKLMELFKD
ncbi:hypothetical protein SAMN05444392_102305 [Seinonella peptonophila]|uniref:Uncharacterized protein n=1 Tax=Seinonella peptonophila TaxID=112248 RepID=A0A1M4VDA6_9BACL|nr:hypothetical protein [Seinonella peptonophila]SHE66951.1 hypothetical protein SAMN05444392_102305 [Seinonella peptonophila]